MSVATKHPQYVQYAETWQALRDALAGSGAVKTATAATAPTRGVREAGTRYLPKPNGMRRAEQYAAYRDRASWFGATARAVQGLTRAAFRHPPQVSVPAAMEAHLLDITGSGLSLEAFAEQAVQQKLLPGRFGILVDYPSEPTTAARPYLVPYVAEDIRNWAHLQHDGQTVLSLVVLQERVHTRQGPWPSPDFFVEQTTVQYRVLRLDAEGYYEVSLWRGAQAERGRQGAEAIFQASWRPTREGVPLTFIPFVLEPDVEASLLEPLVEINFRHYRHSADYEHALHLTALPTPYVCSNSEPPTDPLLIGSATAWWIADNQASVGMLTLPAAGLPAQQLALETDKKDMAVLGARVLEGAPTVDETRYAAAQRTQGAESPMHGLVTLVSRWLTQALRWQAWWGGFTEAVQDPAIAMTLNTDLTSQTMEPQMLTALMQALLNGTISYETWYYQLEQGEIARPQVGAEEEQALLEVRSMALPLALPAGGRNGTRTTTTG